MPCLMETLPFFLPTHSIMSVHVLRAAIPFLQVQLEVNVSFVQDSLRGDDTTELRVKFVKKLEDAVPAGDD